MREGPASWRLVAAGAGGSSLKLVYEAGGCSQCDGRTVVTETRSTIEIEVRHTYLDGGACPAVSISKGLTVRLATPIEGRFISGPNRSGPAGMRLGKVPPGRSSHSAHEPGRRCVPAAPSRGGSPTRAASAW